MPTDLHVSLPTYQRTLGHLFSSLESENAAFLYTRACTSDGRLVLSAEDHHLVPHDGFVRRSAYHFELRDDVQRHVIKEAHARGCCLVEAHSHPFPSPACFSETDVLGLVDWVPHVRWRLSGRPYAALVLAPGSFDAVVFSAGVAPVALDNLVVSGVRIRPTETTVHKWEALSAPR